MMDDAIVIGAGITGLTAAHRLRQRGWNVRVLEKARGVGGRMATRRDGDNGRRWDHGAQFVTARSPEFREDLRGLIESGSLREWGSPFRDGRETRWIHVDGMSALAKNANTRLASSNDPVELSCKVIRITPSASGWTVHSEDGREWKGRTLLLTAPVPQALDLLSASRLTNTSEDSALRSVRYHACFALLASFSEPPGLPEPGGWESPHRDLHGIFDQNRKGLRGNGSAVVIHTTPEASARWLEIADERVQNEIWTRARPFLLGTPIAMKLHRWRYSHPATTYPAMYFEGSESGAPLFLAGDGFGGPRIEGAFLSGRAVAERMIECV